MSASHHCIERAVPIDFLAVSALDRIAWLHLGDTYIPDGEHAWRIWCEYATVLVGRHKSKPLKDSGRIAGALVMFPTKAHELFLHKIMVHPHRRGAGLGSALMRSALDQTDAPVLLTVDPANEAALQLYRNFGFAVREHVEGYYRPHEHRNVMVFTP